VFVAVDYCTTKCVGIHAAKYATRFEALEPIRQVVRRSFGDYGKESASGLILRHDHGSQFVSRAFQAEIHFLGIESSPSYVRSPQGMGCAERFIRTLSGRTTDSGWSRSTVTGLPRTSGLASPRVRRLRECRELVFPQDRRHLRGYNLLRWRGPWVSSESRPSSRTKECAR
jgi:transposase InsO family protein